jgi:hypothetical protein
MFEKLKSKWKVNSIQLLLILCTFAIGGSLTGYISRKILHVFEIDNRTLWLIIYILLITILWPMMVIVVSIFFGQFTFFKQYLIKVGKRMGILKQSK